MMHIPIQNQILSLIGAFFCLFAYVAYQFHWMDARKAPYNLLNLIGSAFLAYVAFRPIQAGFIILEIVWGLASLYGLYKALIKK